MRDEAGLNMLVAPVERDPWAHVEPSRFTYERRYAQPMCIRAPLYVGTLWSHPTMNGGAHEVWEQPDGNHFELWRDATGRIAGGPKSLAA